MDKQQAQNILGNRARWELLHMKKALSSFIVLNTQEENNKLEAVKVLLKSTK